MEVIVLEQKKSIKITSVIITYDEEGDPDHTRVHMFWCYNCQNPLFQYIGKVVSIIPGSTPHTLPIIIKCQRCKNTIQVVDIV